MPDQDMREKVIEGLECCMYDLTCNGCPYWSDDNYCDGGDTLKRDALALLKAQEARVMTLEEALAAEVVYAEDIDKTEIIPVLVSRRAHDRVVLVRAHLMGSPSLTIYPLISEYGKRWRCWTFRPDEMRREAIPWNAQN